MNFTEYLTLKYQKPNANTLAEILSFRDLSFESRIFIDNHFCEPQEFIYECLKKGKILNKTIVFELETSLGFYTGFCELFDIFKPDFDDELNYIDLINIERISITDYEKKILLLLSATELIFDLHFDGSFFELKMSGPLSIGGEKVSGMLRIQYNAIQSLSNSTLCTDSRFIHYSRFELLNLKLKSELIQEILVEFIVSAESSVFNIIE